MSHSMTRYILATKSGDDDAYDSLCRRAYDGVVAVCRRVICGKKFRAIDCEDLTQEAFGKFHQRLQRNGFPKLENRQDFFTIMAMLVKYCAIDNNRKAMAKKRAGTVTLGYIPETPDSEIEDDAQFCLEELLRKLETDTHREIVELFLCGDTQDKIAAELHLSLRTVQRKWGDVRAVLKDMCGIAAAK